MKNSDNTIQLPQDVIKNFKEKQDSLPAIVLANQTEVITKKGVWRKAFSEPLINIFKKLDTIV